jgi:chromosome segregation ATPase
LSKFAINDNVFPLWDGRYTNFCRVLEGSSLEEATDAYNDLLADLYTIQAHLLRLKASAEAYRREQELYRERQEQLSAAILQAEKDISVRKEELEEARAELVRQQEYEKLKANVTSVPARSKTATEMAAVNSEIADLSQQGALLETAMDRRRTQFATIIRVIEQIYGSIGDGEGRIEEGVPPEKNAGTPMDTS